MLVVVELVVVMLSAGSVWVMNQVGVGLIG